MHKINTYVHMLNIKIIIRIFMHLCELCTIYTHIFLFKASFYYNHMNIKELINHRRNCDLISLFF